MTKILAISAFVIIIIELSFNKSFKPSFSSLEIYELNSCFVDYILKFQIAFAVSDLPLNLGLRFDYF